MEQKVIKTGLLRLQRSLCSGSATGVLELPRCADGTPKVVQGRSFLLQLLNDKVEFKGCSMSDVAAAQSDLRHLSSEQLLTIRCQTLEFATQSASHSAHLNFLEMVDRQLFAKLARRCLRESTEEPARPEPLHAMGLRLTLLLGAEALLADGWGRLANGVAEPPPKPVCWVIHMAQMDWPGECQAATFNTTELRLEVLPGECPDFASQVAAGERLAVVVDRSSGQGVTRMLHWEIAAMDPREEDIMEELVQKDTLGSSQKGSLTHELSAALAKRGGPPTGSVKIMP